MKNKYGETVIPQYEVAWLTWDLEHNPNAKQDHDVWSFSFSVADNYRDAVRIAKSDSLKIGEQVRGDYGIGELVDVRIVCYFEDDDCSYNQVWWEYYEKGKKVDRFLLDD